MALCGGATCANSRRSTSQEALERFALLRPHLEQGSALPPLARAGNVSLRAARRWVQLYRAHGLIGLARKGRTDRRARRSISEEGAHIIEGLALQRPPLSAAAIHREIARWARKANQPVPSHDTVRRIVKVSLRP
jgi:putative transposase